MSNDYLVCLGLFQHKQFESHCNQSTMLDHNAFANNYNLRTSVPLDGCVRLDGFILTLQENHFLRMLATLSVVQLIIIINK